MDRAIQRFSSLYFQYKGPETAQSRMVIHPPRHPPIGHDPTVELGQRAKGRHEKDDTGSSQLKSDEKAEDTLGTFPWLGRFRLVVRYPSRIRGCMWAYRPPVGRVRRTVPYYGP